MQGIRFNYWACKSRTKTALTYPFLVPSTRAAISACGQRKKKTQPSGLPAATLRPLAGPPHSTPKLSITQPPLPLNTYTPPAHAEETTIPEQFSSGNKLIFLPCTTFPVGELSAGSANGIPRGCAPSSCSPVLLSALHLVPTLLVHSWLTPDSTAQAPSKAPQFYFRLACSP